MASDQPRPDPRHAENGVAAPPGAPRASDGSRPEAMELLQLVMSTPDVESYLGELARVAAGLDPAIGGVGVTLRRDGRVMSVATSNDLAASVDELQYGLDAGPCLESLRTGTVVIVVNMTAEDRWDGYPGHAMARGVRSSLSLPLEVEGTTVGALNVYGTGPALFGGELAQRLRAFAVHAQMALTFALRQASQSSTVEQLHTAMQSRSVIDQALGILMERSRSTADEAFAVLRTASQSRNRRLADIAAEIITATTGHPPRAGRFEL